MTASDSCLAPPLPIPVVGPPDTTGAHQTVACARVDELAHVAERAAVLVLLSLAERMQLGATTHRGMINEWVQR